MIGGYKDGRQDHRKDKIKAVSPTEWRPQAKPVTSRFCQPGEQQPVVRLEAARSRALYPACVNPFL